MNALTGDVCPDVPDANSHEQFVSDANENKGKRDENFDLISTILYLKDRQKEFQDGLDYDYKGLEKKIEL